MVHCESVSSNLKLEGLQTPSSEAKSHALDSPAMSQSTQKPSLQNFLQIQHIRLTCLSIYSNFLFKIHYLPSLQKL